MDGPETRPTNDGPETRLTNIGNRTIFPSGADVVKQDIDYVLEGWEYKPGMVQPRLVQAPGPGGGRQVIQMRIDLGILQLESTGRPDGTRPHNHSSYLSYLREQARL